MESRDYYQVLGVSRYASEEAIRRAFRLRVFDSHPDRNLHDPSAGERTRAIIEAYHALIARERDAAESAVVRPQDHSRSPSTGACGARTAPRALGLLGAVLVCAFAAALIWSAAFGDRTRVYRPQFVPQPEYAVSRLAACGLVEPGLADIERYYWTVEYDVSLGAGWAEKEVIELLPGARHSLEAFLNGRSLFR